ncbi:hypothetical protein HPP92_010539 [Vanilla planifolia]|uniref:Uncharacterized protein n=1 Tax=Vanilla planifolia TaxID=51239 RepID=A0A835V3J9_VANPL|nr:hypothetical protein HPP92_010539 [Vanilla planifolia]
MNVARVLNRFSSSSALFSLPFTSSVRRAYRMKSKSPAIDTESSSSAPTTLVDQSQLPRPCEIPFQAKVANSVHLVGTISSDVSLQTQADGSHASVTVLLHENIENLRHSSRFRIPVIFQGDLAEIAACHLKENDHIYVSGQLIGDALLSATNDAKANIKLLARSLNFVEGANSSDHKKILHKRDKLSSADSGIVKSDNASKSLWEDLLVEAQNWFDNREKKLKGLVNPKSPDFKHKETGNGLWLDTAPGWVLPKLEGLVFCCSTGKAARSNKDEVEVLWKKLLDNPSHWWDNRSKKA